MLYKVISSVNAAYKKFWLNIFRSSILWFVSIKVRSISKTKMKRYAEIKKQFYFSFYMFFEISFRQICCYFRGNFQQRFCFWIYATFSFLWQICCIFFRSAFLTKTDFSQVNQFFLSSCLMLKVLVLKIIWDAEVES